MTHTYTEELLVEAPAAQLFGKLGWQTISALDEIIGENGTLGRETKAEVVLLARLRPALERLNPHLPREAISAAIDELTRDRSAMSLVAANRDVYSLRKLAALESEYDAQFKVVFDAIRELTSASSAEAADWISCSPTGYARIPSAETELT